MLIAGLCDPLLVGQGGKSSGWEVRMRCPVSNLIASLPVIQKPSFVHTFLKGFSKTLNLPLKILIMMVNGPFGVQQFSLGFTVPGGTDFNLEFSTWKL